MKKTKPLKDKIKSGIIDLIIELDWVKIHTRFFVFWIFWLGIMVSICLFELSNSMYLTTIEILFWLSQLIIFVVMSSWYINNAVRMIEK